MGGSYMIRKTKQGKGIENGGNEFLYIDWSRKTHLRSNMKLWKAEVDFLGSVRVIISSKDLS